MRFNKVFFILRHKPIATFCRYDTITLAFGKILLKGDTTVKSYYYINYYPFYKRLNLAIKKLGL